METETDVLRRAGLNVTLRRIHLLQALREFKRDDERPTAEEVFRKIHANGHKISQAAVYQVLAQFEQAELIQRHHFARQQPHARYELNHQNHHYHMVNVDTGKIIAFSDASIEQRLQQLIKEYGFELDSRDVVVYVRES
jgi:Fur family ferric uptake transcriptional regulator